MHWIGHYIKYGYNSTGVQHFLSGVLLKFTRLQGVAAWVYKSQCLSMCLLVCLPPNSIPFFLSFLNEMNVMNSHTDWLKDTPVGIIGTIVWPQQTGRLLCLSRNFNGIRDPDHSKTVKFSFNPTFILYRNLSNNWGWDAIFPIDLKCPRCFFFLYEENQ